MNSKPSSQWLAYLQLFRAPNVFTAAADVSMGRLFVAGTLAPPGPFLLLLAASCLLYTAGMVLNDVYDVEIDRKERPQRPLPSGRISVRTAKTLGYGMLLLGIAAGWAAGFAAGDAAIPWRSGAVATLLAACVVCYDAGAKRTPLGPLVMGGCRFLNVLLGMSAPALAMHGGSFAGYSAAELVVAGGIGLYIVGVTWFARTEAVESNATHLLGGTCVMIAGIGLLAAYPQLSSAPSPQFAGFGGALSPSTVWLAFLVLISLPVLRRCLVAAADPAPHRVQAAVKRCILSLIVYDAAVTLAAAGPLWAILVLALLAPTVLLGAWIYST
ncbi:MAG: UbiA family prenyltransferase [Planctomycetes bacterium]|nr:UbiA family prenyltransferase [Planctomycetota bacterium]